MQDTSTALLGSASARIDEEGGYSHVLAGALDRTYHLRTAIRVSDPEPASNMALQQVFSPTNGTLLQVFLVEWGELTLWNNFAGANLDNAGVGLDANVWYQLELKIHVPAAGAGTAAFRLHSADGQLLYDSGDIEANLGNAAISHLTAGRISGGSGSVYIDELAVNDDTGGASNSWPGSALLPSNRCLWGALMSGEHYNPAWDKAPYQTETWDTFEANAGRRVGLVHGGDPWLTWDGFGAGATGLVRSRGAVPLKSLGDTTNPDLVAEVLAGEHDVAIDAWAEAAKEFRSTIYLRPLWEMNGTWYPWGRHENYVAAWQYLHGRIKAIAPNVEFVWCVNTIWEDPESDPGPWYPGDAYVDWIGLDGYTGRSPAKDLGWFSANTLLVPTYERLRELAPTKPVMICEVGVSEYGPEGEIDGTKAVWLTELLRTTIPHNMPEVRALAYFNWEIEEGEGLLDWPIESSEAAQAAFAAEIAPDYYYAPKQGRVAVTREFPPVRHSVIVRDPKTGAPIARWAEDEGKPHNVMNGLQLSGLMPGGRKDLKATLPRNPRQDWPDTEGFLEIEAQLPGRKRIWHGRIGRAPRTDGDRMVISGEAVGYAAALEDRKALQVGIIDSDYSKWGEPSTSRRLALAGSSRLLQAQATTGWQAAGSELPALVFDYSGLLREKSQIFGNELWYYGGGVDLGALLFDWLGDASTTWENYGRLVDSDLPDAGPPANFDASSNYSGVASATAEEVTASASGRKYAAFRSFYTGAFVGTMTNIMRAANVKVLSRLAQQNLVLQGTWPNVGYTIAQILRLVVPEFSELRATDESVEDDGLLVSQAWWTDPPGTLARIVDELIRLSLYDWFVKDAKLFEVREPGSYGTRWQAYQGPANFEESGTDTERSWDRIVVGWRDPDGRTRFVGWPGSGFEFEDPRLQITDPDHPAVRAGAVREDLLMLDIVASPSRGAEIGERWLAEANELPRSGRAVFADYLMDEKGIWRPAAEVAEGDLVRFPESRDKSYRKVVDYTYGGDDRKCAVGLDAPSETLKALNERYRAALMPLGLR